MGLKFQPCIIAVRDCRAKAEKRGCCVSARVDGQNAYRSYEIEKRPNCTKAQLNLYPWYSEEPLDDMEQVEAEKYARKPKSNHRYRIEVSAAGQVCVSRHLNTNKSEKIENLSRV